jgi:hypothetical protein
MCGTWIAMVIRMQIPLKLARFRGLVGAPQ